MSVAGEIDQASAPQLRAGLAEAAACQPALLELDLTGVTFCSTAGLSELFMARDLLDGRLVVTGVRRPVRRLLEVLHLQPLMQAA